MQKGSTVLWVPKKKNYRTSRQSMADSLCGVFQQYLKVLNEDKKYNMKTALAIGFWNEGKLSSETKFVRNLPGLEASVWFSRPSTVPPKVYRSISWFWKFTGFLGTSNLLFSDNGWISITSIFLVRVIIHIHLCQFSVSFVSVQRVGLIKIKLTFVLQSPCLDLEHMYHNYQTHWDILCQSLWKNPKTETSNTQH